MIFKHETYENDAGAVIQAKVPIKPADMPLDDLPSTRYSSVGETDLPNGEKRAFEFTIPATTLDEAFANAPVACEAAADGVRKQWSQQNSKPKIIRAGAGAIPRLSRGR